MDRMDELTLQARQEHEETTLEKERLQVMCWGCVSGEVPRSC